MQSSSLRPERVLTDRSTTLFEAVYARELGFVEYVELLDEVLDPDMAFFLRNSYAALTYNEGGD